MARGWESKSVESQREDRDQSRGERGRERTRDEIERESRRESLESSRRGVLKELETSRSPVHRATLEQALKHLEDEIANLTVSS